jgi:PKD repeat protein
MLANGLYNQERERDMQNLNLGLLVIVAIGSQAMAQSNPPSNFQGDLDPYRASRLNVREMGDVNGDGLKEIVIGKGWQDVARADEGAIWVVMRSEECLLGESIRITEGEGGLELDLHPGDRFGSSVASLGDLDGDGIADLVVGIPGSDQGGWFDAGALQVLFLAPDGSVAREQTVSATQGSLHATLFHGSRFGQQLANMGDLDGDGLPELAVSVSSDPGTLGGFVLSLGPDGHVLREWNIDATVLATSDGAGSLESLFVASLTSSSAPFALAGPSLVGSVVGLTGSDPMADFDADVLVGTRPLNVNFQDLSSGTGITAWDWDFGDNHGSSAQNPLHPFYTILGFDITLTVTGALGSDTEFKPKFIEVQGVTGAIRVNGNSVNPLIFESFNVPDFGTQWETRINGTSIGGMGLTFIFAYSEWLEPTLSPFGEFLVDPNSTVFATSIVAIDPNLGYAAHFLAVPLDVNAFGVAVFTQGYVNNTGMGSSTLTNALYVILATPPGVGG